MLINRVKNENLFRVKIFYVEVDKKTLNFVNEN